MARFADWIVEVALWESASTGLSGWMGIATTLRCLKPSTQIDNRIRDRTAPSGLPALPPEDCTCGSIPAPTKSLAAIRLKRVLRRNMTGAFQVFRLGEPLALDRRAPLGPGATRQTPGPRGVRDRRRARESWGVPLLPGKIYNCALRFGATFRVRDGGFRSAQRRVVSGSGRSSHLQHPAQRDSRLKSATSCPLRIPRDDERVARAWNEKSGNLVSSPCRRVALSPCRT
jgi:hypothetical protein